MNRNKPILTGLTTFFISVILACAFTLFSTGILAFDLTRNLIGEEDATTENWRTAISHDYESALSDLPPDFMVDTLSVDRLNAFLSDRIQQSEQFWSTDQQAAKNKILEGFDSIPNAALNDTLVANAYHVLGKILIDLKETQAGIDTLKQCLILKRAIYGEDHPILYKTYNYIGVGYFYLNDYPHAIEFYKKAASMTSKLAGSEKDWFWAMLNVGIVSATTGKYDIALHYFDSASTVIDSPLLLYDTIARATFYSNYGLLSTMMGKIEEGNHYFNLSESLYSAKYGALYPRIAMLNINKGINAHFNYDFAKAKLYFKNAIDIYMKTDNSNLSIAKAYSNLGATYIKTAHYKEAIRCCLLGLEYEPDNNLKILLYQNLAHAYMLSENIKMADEYYQYALELTKYEYVNETRVYAMHLLYADFLFETGSDAESLKYYNSALKWADEIYGSTSQQSALILSKLGWYHLKNTADLEIALSFFEQSIEIWTKELLLDQPTVEPENFNEIRFTDAFYGKAQSLFLMYNQSGNIQYLRDCSQTLKWLLSRMELVSHNLDNENRIILNENIKPIYDLAIHISYKLFKSEGIQTYLADAFGYSEKSKAAILLSSVRNNVALRTSDVPEYVIHTEYEMQQEINILRQELAEEGNKEKPSNKKLTFFENRILFLMLQHDSLVRKLEQSYPRYYSLKYDWSVVSLDEIMDKLDNDEVLIEYEITDTSLYIYCVDKSEGSIEMVSVDSSFNQALQYLIGIKETDISKHNLIDYQTFTKYASLLWAKLIQPISERIENKRLVIVPDGLLGYLPFEVLIKNADGVSPMFYRDLPYLLKDHAISYTYSSTLLFHTISAEKTKRGEMKNMLAFAPRYVKQTEGEQLSDNQFADLPYAQEEVIEIKKIMGGITLMNDQATKKRFLKEAESGEILHMAMHAQVNDTLPMFSNLVFYQKPGDTMDRRLYTYEIFGLDLNASMVTLSACNTGSGLYQKGEGIMSFARGFLYAGVPSIIMTLWEVQDQSGAQIMQGFYSNLKSGDKKDVALQKAKLDMLSNANLAKSHPYFWSAYILSGETKAIPVKEEHSYWLIMSIIVSVVFIVALILIFKKNANT